jgi:HAD superfamily hydrolase (TIGR01509 family)
VVSSSANTAQVLAVTGLGELVELRVDRASQPASGSLPGKPAPDTFLAAAADLGVPAAQCVVFEDALAGVQAGRAGDFGYVVGVDRVGQAEALRAQGADVVVQDLEELLP